MMVYKLLFRHSQIDAVMNKLPFSLRLGSIERILSKYVTICGVGGITPLRNFFPLNIISTDNKEVLKSWTVSSRTTLNTCYAFQIRIKFNTPRLENTEEKRQKKFRQRVSNKGWKSKGHMTRSKRDLYLRMMCSYL